MNQLGRAEEYMEDILETSVKIVEQLQITRIKLSALLEEFKGETQMASANMMIIHAQQEMVYAEKNISNGDREKALDHIRLAEGSIQEMARRVDYLIQIMVKLRDRAEGMRKKPSSTKV